MKVMLVGFPTGLILFSIIAVFIYFQLEEKKTARSIKYAAGLRMELTEATLMRHLGVLETAQADALKGKLTASSYVGSTLGPENMGYQTRILRDSEDPGVPINSIDVELTGNKRPRDVVLVLSDYTDPVAVSHLLAIAHDITGEAPHRTLRIALVKDASALADYYDKCVAVDERITQVLLLGALAQQKDADLQQTFHLMTGVPVLRPELGLAMRTPLQSAKELRQQLLDHAQRL
jgi:hypothetical protein